MKADRMLGLAVVLLAALFLGLAVPAIEVATKEASGPGYYMISPRLFPGAIGLLGAFLGAWVAWRPDEQRRSEAPGACGKRRHLLLLLGLAATYVGTLELLGFTLASALVLAALFRAFGERRWPVITVLAIGVPVLVALTFARLCLVALPPGRLGLPF